MRQKFKVSIFSIVAVSLLSFQLYSAVPKRLTVLDGQSYSFPKIISGLTSGKSTQIKLFGIVPIKTIPVDVIENTTLIPSGKTIGVKINVEGIMVLGFLDFKNNTDKKVCPAKEFGIRTGDIIKTINGTAIKTITQLSKIVEDSKGQELKFSIVRGKDTVLLNCLATISKEDGKYKLGAWVRDGTSGIGTLTFIEPKTGVFGALGHAITDTDTNDIIPVGNGQILNSNVVDIEKGKKGEPGELKGIFTQSEKIGTISNNNDLGIFGKIDSLSMDKSKPLKIALHSQIKQGKAHILCNIDGDNVEKYDIEILKINNNSYDNKGLVIKITDERLLEKTGGIVQGMSGSPIIQDDKLVGAVTHVFVNDPTKGYGAFIELMLSHMNQ